MDNFYGGIKLENKEFNWEEVVNFFSKKYILTRASFINSSAVVTDNKVSVNLSSKGKFLLLQKNIDKTVSDFIFNTTGKRYEIEFIEPNIDNFAENRNSLEADLVKNLLDENAKKAQELQLQKNQEELKKKEKKAREVVTKSIANPNGNDDYKGFVGPSGEELNSLLASVDMNNGGETAPVQKFETPPVRKNKTSFCSKKNYK